MISSNGFELLYLRDRQSIPACFLSLSCLIICNISNLRYDCNFHRAPHDQRNFRTYPRLPLHPRARKPQYRNPYLNPGYRNRFQIPTDLLYYRYNAGRVPSRGTSTGVNSVFDPIDPSTPDIFDYDYDVNVNYDRPNGTPTPQLGVLPEQAVALANTKSRKARLWRKVYYLQYLRELYRKTYADYYNDYYYGIQGSGNYGRLTKSDSPRDE